MFDANDLTRVDRRAMLHVGARMVAAYPLTGVGPNMVEPRYREFLSSSEPQHVNPHLHNVPMQIAAERGLPALAVWLWLIVTLVVGLMRRLRVPEARFLAAAALASIIAMLAAGQFEYNFGDSEFLMLFLVLMTLPFAAEPSCPPLTRRFGRSIAPAANNSSSVFPVCASSFSAT